MPCEVCSAWPTWADLSECDKPNCPWVLDLGKPIPLLPKSLRDPPPHTRVSPPLVVTSEPVVRGPLPAMVDVETPPVHSWASITSGALKPKPAVVETPTPEPNAVPKVPAKTVVPLAPPKPRFSCDQVKDDYNTIMDAVDSMNWSGKFGPSFQVDTQLKWEDKLCRELYLAVKDDLHDKSFMVGRKRLYYYVGAIGNWGKAGFRITGHTKPAAKIKSSETCGVLHIENR